MYRRATQAVLVLDVILLVLELCEDNTRTLYACSLVAKSWRTIAQRRLLSSVSIHLSHPSRAPEAFLAFLDSHPHFHSHIRNVRIAKELHRTENFRWSSGRLNVKLLVGSKGHRRVESQLLVCGHGNCCKKFEKKVPLPKARSLRMMGG